MSVKTLFILYDFENGKRPKCMQISFVKEFKKMGRKMKIYTLTFRLLSASIYATTEEKCQNISLC